MHGVQILCGRKCLLGAHLGSHDRRSNRRGTQGSVDHFLGAIYLFLRTILKYARLGYFKERNLLSMYLIAAVPKNPDYLTISHRRRREYRRIVTETKSRRLSRYSQSLRWLIVLVKLHWWLFEKIKQKLLNLRLRNINKSGRHFENWKPSLL